MKKLAILICMLLCVSVNVSAIDPLDVNQKGSIHITLKDPKTNEPIQSGNFSIYKVADVVIENGNPKYVYTDAFKHATTSLDNLQSATLLQSTLNYINVYKVKGTTLPVENGSISFDGLSVGLYLVKNPVIMEGYNEVSPFLVSIPNKVNNQYNYQVEASPKMSITTKPTTPPKPPHEIPPVIPVTGVLWWPVPVLSVLGLLFISVGYIKKFKYEKNI